MGLEVKLAFVGDLLVFLQNIIEVHTCLNFQMDKLVCGVCGGKSPTGLHYGATTCYPCRAFFRFLFFNLDQIFHPHSIGRTYLSNDFFDQSPVIRSSVNFQTLSWRNHLSIIWDIALVPVPILMTILHH